MRKPALRQTYFLFPSASFRTRPASTVTQPVTVSGSPSHESHHLRPRATCAGTWALHAQNLHLAHINIGARHLPATLTERSATGRESRSTPPPKRRDARSVGPMPDWV